MSYEDISAAWAGEIATRLSQALARPVRVMIETCTTEIRVHIRIPMGADAVVLDEPIPSEAIIASQMKPEALLETTIAMLLEKLQQFFANHEQK